MSPAALLTDHLTRLTDALATLKNRLRAAVVGELSRLASDTLKDVIQTLLEPIPARSIRPDRESDPWDDDSNPDDEWSTGIGAEPVARPWWGWLAAAGRLLLAGLTGGRRPWWSALALAAAGVAALTSQPLAVAALAVAHAALDLLGP